MRLTVFRCKIILMMLTVTQADGEVRCKHLPLSMSYFSPRMKRNKDKTMCRSLPAYPDLRPQAALSSHPFSQALQKWICVDLGLAEVGLSGVFWQGCVEEKGAKG